MNVGDDVAELTADVGIVIGIAMGSLETFPLLMGELMDGWESRRYCKDGETARRFALGG